MVMYSVLVYVCFDTVRSQRMSSRARVATRIANLWYFGLDLRWLVDSGRLSDLLVDQPTPFITRVFTKLTVTGFVF